MTLDLAGHEFPLRADLPKGGAFVVFAKRMRDASNAEERLALIFDMAALLVEDTVASDGTSLEDAICEVEIDDLESAVAAAVKQYGDRPTERPSDSSDGSQTTPTSSRVVSFSRGTVEQVPAASQTG